MTLVDKPERKKLLTSLGVKCKYNIKLYLTEVSCESVIRINFN
jgi:hypothetical protein